MNQHDLFGDAPVDYSVEEETKPCKVCKEVKPVLDFSPNAGSTARRNTCKPCALHQSKVTAHLRKETPYPDADYSCPVCTSKADELAYATGKRKTIWFLDHDHTTDKFRGWLCLRCNIAAGQLRDDPDNAKRLSEYLSNAGN